MRFIVFVFLAVIGIAMSIAAYQWSRPDGLLVYWGILPGAPFVLLGAGALVTRVPLRVTVGASIASLLTVAVTYGGLIFASTFGAGGGANIGLGLLLLATPVLLPVAMMLGGFAGWQTMKSQPKSDS